MENSCPKSTADAGPDDTPGFRLIAALLIIAAILGFAWLLRSQEVPTPADQPAPVAPDKQPESKPEPKQPRKPLFPRPADEIGQLVMAGPVAPPSIETISIGGPTGPDGTEVQVDLPVDQRIKNIGSHVDGAGMCVDSSIEMAARWAGLEQMRGFRDWAAKQPGGGYPSKVDRQIKAFCAEKRIPVPEYIQYEGNDSAILEAILKTGRAAAGTYAGFDGVRYKGRIAHMVCVVTFLPKWATVLDNNAIGTDQLLWMTPAEYVTRWKSGGGGWVFCWLAPPPPPVPRNLIEPPKK